MEKNAQRRLLKFNKHCLSATTVAPATLGETPKTPVALNAHMNAQVNAHVSAHAGADDSHLSFEVTFLKQ